MAVESFRKMELELSGHIGKQELDAMKFLSSDHISKKRMQEITSALELWIALEERELISAGNTRYLKDLVKHSTNGRTAVVHIIDQYEANRLRNNGFIQPISNSDVRHIPMETQQAGAGASQGSLQNIIKEIEFVSKNIGRDWKYLMRSLGLTEAELEEVMNNYPRNMREQIRQALLMWAQNPLSPASKEGLIRALVECQRNDLVHSLKSGNY